MRPGPGRCPSPGGPGSLWISAEDQLLGSPWLDPGCPAPRDGAARSPRNGGRCGAGRAVAEAHPKRSRDRRGRGGVRSRGCGPWGAWRGTEAPPDLRERTLPPGGERLPRGPHARGAFVSRPSAAPGGWGPWLETSEGRVSSEASLCGCVFTGHPAARVCAMKRALKGAARTSLNARLCQVAILAPRGGDWSFPD